MRKQKMRDFLDSILRSRGFIEALLALSFIILIELTPGVRATEHSDENEKNAPTTLGKAGAVKGASAPKVLFAVIGDYGSETNESRKVSELVKSRNPDFILTTGDNNYPSGEADTIDKNVGSLYSDYIFPYTGSYEKPSILSQSVLAVPRKS